MFDYRQGYAAIREEIDTALRGVLDSGQLILGSRLRAFESHFASFLGSPGHAVGVGNGTDALAIALRSLGIREGDEVLTVPNTAIPTVSAIRMTGAVPRFVDVLNTTCLIDVEAIERQITSRTKAIIPVHLYGNAVDMEPILEIAKAHSLKVVEDCAQSTGTMYNGRATGTFGDVGCFSFYPTKNLGAYGDAGLCFTRDPEIAETIRQIRMYGCASGYCAEREGINSRLDELQAAILDVKLRHLPEYLVARRRIASRYNDRLASSVDRPTATNGSEHSYHLFVIKTDARARLTERLQSQRIGFGIHYPMPIHLMKAYSFLGYRPGDFPVSERLAGQVLSLPCFPELPGEAIDRVCSEINEFYNLERQALWETSPKL
jgi:dTDP-4-amino-4,6-dideoxygalactose transaminase